MLRTLCAFLLFCCSTSARPETAEARVGQAVSVPEAQVQASGVEAPAPQEPALDTESQQQAEDAPPPRLRARDFSETNLISNAGLQYRILVSAPRGEAPPGGFPVVYVLDGDAFFNTAVEIARMREWGRLSASIVVGIAYPSGVFYDGPRRTYDFTSPGSAEADLDPSELGGADEFLAFLNNELKPLMASRYATDAEREILFGHSLGAMFVLHALASAPDSFDVYLAASPTLRFSDSLILREVGAFAQRRAGAGVRAFISVGTLEGPPGAEQIDDWRRYFNANPQAAGGLETEEALRQLFPRDGFNKVRETGRLARLLSRSGASVTFVALEGDEHLPAGVSGLSRGIAFALRPPGQ